MQKTISNNVFFQWVKSELEEGHEVTIRIKGNSMFPLLRNDLDKVTLTPCHGKELHLLDIVLFEYRNNYILHRIVKMEEDRLTLQGDGNYNIQEHCNKKDVIGIVRQITYSSGRTMSVNARSAVLYSSMWFKLRKQRRYLLYILYRFNGISRRVKRLVKK